MKCVSLKKGSFSSNYNILHFEQKCIKRPKLSMKYSRKLWKNGIKLKLRNVQGNWSRKGKPKDYRLNSVVWYSLSLQSWQLFKNRIPMKFSKCLKAGGKLISLIVNGLVGITVLVGTKIQSWVQHLNFSQPRKKTMENRISMN